MRQRLGTLLRRVFAKDDGVLWYALRTTLFTLVCIAFVLAPATWLFDFDNPPAAESPLRAIVLALLLAPLLENLAIVAVVGALHARSASVVLVGVAVLGVVMHLSIGPARAISGTIGFCVLGYTFIHWSNATWTRRYWISVLQHGLMNLPGTALFALGID